MWVTIAGVDGEPVLRRGDVSMSGMFVETDQRVGEPGSVQTVTVTSFARESSVELLARIVRLVLVHDLWHGSGVAGIALEFLLDNLEKRQQLEAVIRDVMASRSYVAESLGGAGQAADQLDPPPVEPEPAGDAAGHLGVRVMVLDAGWPVSVGESIRCRIETPQSGRQAELTGRVMRSTIEPTDAGARYRLEVDFARAVDQARVAEGRSISDAMDSLLEEVVFPDLEAPRPRSREHLRGLLARIRLPSLLAFCELERLSGVLSLQRDGEQGQVFLRNGQVVDAELERAGADPRTVIAELCGWEDGTFDFSLREVQRADRLQLSTSALLLTLAQERDEA